MTELENCHFANLDEIIDSGKDRLWVLKPPGERLLVNRLSQCSQCQFTDLLTATGKMYLHIGKTQWLPPHSSNQIWHH